MGKSAREGAVLADHDQRHEARTQVALLAVRGREAADVLVGHRFQRRHDLRAGFRAAAPSAGPA